MGPARRATTDAARTVTLAIAFFGALALAAWRGGVLEQLGPEVTTALAVFALAFIALTLACDAELRAWLAATARAARRGFKSAGAKSPAVKRAAS